MTNALPMLVGKQNGLLGLATICPPKKLRTGKAKRRNYDLASYTCTDWSADIAFMSYEASIKPLNGKLRKTDVHEFVRGTTARRLLPNHIISHFTEVGLLFEGDGTASHTSGRESRRAQKLYGRTFADVKVFCDGIFRDLRSTNSISATVAKRLLQMTAEDHDITSCQAISAIENWLMPGSQDMAGFPSPKLLKNWRNPRRPKLKKLYRTLWNATSRRRVKRK
jgi:hypothetical protein